MFSEIPAHLNWRTQIKKTKTTVQDGVRSPTSYSDVGIVSGGTVPTDPVFPNPNRLGNSRLSNTPHEGRRLRVRRLESETDVM